MVYYTENNKMLWCADTTTVIEFSSLFQRILNSVSVQNKNTNQNRKEEKQK